MDKLVTYRITADEELEFIDQIAVTANPAIMIKGVKLSDQKESKIMALKEVERQVIAGPALIPNLKIFRKDEDGEYYVTFSEDVITQLVEKFGKNKTGQVFNDEHGDTGVPCFVMEHWIIEDPEMDKSKKFGFDLPKGTWFVMAKCTDDKFWTEQVKNNEKFGFSIEGLLGLKLNRKSTMSTPRKFTNVNLEDGTVIYIASMEVGAEAFSIMEDGSFGPLSDGDYVLESGEVVSVLDGLITAIKEKEAEAEAELAEDEPKEEKLAEDEPKEEELESELAEDEPKEEEAELAEDEPKEEEAEEVAEEVTLTETMVAEMIDAKLKEVFDAIAEIKGEMIDDEDVTANLSAELSEVSRKALALKTISEKING